MSKEQFTPQPNHRDKIDDLTALVDAVHEAEDRMKQRARRYKPAPSVRVQMALDRGELRTKIKDLESANRQAENEIKRHPRQLVAAFVLGGVATAATLGLLGMIKPMESKPRVASDVITIYHEDPLAIREQICDTQHNLEQELGLPKSLPYDSFKGCEGTTRLATRDGKEEIHSGDKVKVTVRNNFLFDEDAEAEKVEKPE